MTMMTDKITTTDVKRFNKNRIFRLIHNTEKISRQEIADLLQLSLPTVNQNLKALTDMNLIRFGGSFESTGGRKAQAISVNGMAKFAISVNILNTGIKVALVNLQGDILCSEKKSMLFSTDSIYARTIAELVEDIVRRNNINKEDVLGVGLTVPGIFDTDNKVILSAPTIGIKGYSVSQLTQHIPFKTCAMNDARASAYAEFWFDHNEDTDTLVNSTRYCMSEAARQKSGKMYLMLNDGVGGCFIDRETIQLGKHNRYGEFGHMTIHPDGRRCNCGKKGCLEAYVSARKLSSDLGISLDEFFAQVKQDNPDYVNIFNDYLNDLTIGINNIFLMCDGDIVVGGPVAKYLVPYKDRIKAMLIEKYSFDTDGAYFGFAKCSSEQSDLGAALTFLGEYISNI